MRALSATELLDIWEQGRTGRPAQQALMLLAAAWPDMPADVLAGFSIGRRDACLLTLREWTFGPQLACLTTCPQCGERLELSFDVKDIRAPSPLTVDDAIEGKILSLNVAGYEVRFRLPSSLDLITVSGSADVAASRHLLLERCLLAARYNGEEMAADQLPTEAIEAVVVRMAQADPQADVRLALSCPSCSHRWQAAFDIASFFWSEINAWAYRTLREVHTLASAYGWREADILALSPWRRQAYLELVNVRWADSAQSREDQK
jgi:hypothetical protein